MVLYKTLRIGIIPTTGFVMGAVIIATREKKPEYTLPKYKGG